MYQVFTAESNFMNKKKIEFDNINSDFFLNLFKLFKHITIKSTVLETQVNKLSDQLFSAWQS